MYCATDGRLEPYCVTCAHRARGYTERPTGAGQWMAFSFFGWRPCRLREANRRIPAGRRALFVR